MNGPSDLIGLNNSNNGRTDDRIRTLERDSLSLFTHCINIKIGRNELVKSLYFLA